MTTLTNGNYFSTESNKSYWSVSSFKAFDRCEACGLASVRGQYKREETDSVLIGSYVDAYFTGDFDKFQADHEEQMWTKKGTLRSTFETANRCINAVESQPLMLDFLDGEHQVIRTGTLFGVDWKIKMDVFNGDRIVDLKCMRDFEPVYREGFGRISWVEAWGYDIQGAVYQKIVELNTGKRLPFYIVGVTKEKVPDVTVLQIPQPVLDTALKIVESKIDRFDLIKTGEIEPEGCGHCEWCKSTKILTKPTIYDIEA